MTKARENSDYTGLQGDLAGLQTNITAGDTAARAGRKNLIINGAMQVSQRGTTMSNSGANSSYHTLDRWQTHGSGGTYNLSQQTMTAGTSNQAGGCSKFARFSVITGDNNLGLRQCIEDVESIPAGYTVAVSFYAKGTAGKVIGTFIQSIFGTGGSTSMSHAGSISEHTLTTSWTRYTSTFTMPSDYLTGKTIGANSFNRLQFRQPEADTSTTAWVLDVTGVQLEVGSVATDFEHRSYGEILADCQRYFYNPLYNLGGSRGQFTLDYLVSSGNNGWITWIVPFPVSMRANSTFSHSLTPAKFLGSAAPADGADNFSFYIQNQGYAGLVGNGSIANLGGGGQYHGIVGTYYCSPSSTSASHIFIGNGCTFQFSAEL